MVDIVLCWQGPALCVYNDAEFTDSDWEGIRKLHESIKKDDPLKVGRFGLGFKSVFHLAGRCRLTLFINALNTSVQIWNICTCLCYDFFIKLLL